MPALHCHKVLLSLPSFATSILLYYFHSWLPEALNLKRLNVELWILLLKKIKNKIFWVSFLFVPWWWICMKNLMRMLNIICLTWIMSDHFRLLWYILLTCELDIKWRTSKSWSFSSLSFFETSKKFCLTVPV
jgi:hypothetical protein